MNKLIKFFTRRLVLVSLLILLQFLLIAATLILPGKRYFAIYYLTTWVMGVIFMFRIINRKDNPGYKIGWLIIVLLLPPFGVAVYIIFRGNALSKRKKEKLASIEQSMKRGLEETIGDARAYFDDPEAKKQSDYITNCSFTNPYSDGDIEYYPTGEDMLEPFLEALRSAEKYIFIEYFIIGRGKMWDSVHEILLEKVRQGLDVRVIYDDMGSINSVGLGFRNELEKEGIKCQVFSRYIPVLYARLNNRDHRKICSVDGKVAFTGGVNIADEYINEITRFGYWKDNAVRVTGRCAWAFTAMFLSMWEYYEPSPDGEDVYKNFMPDSFPESTPGVVQPYADNPMDDLNVGETIYLNMLYGAKKYVWITTPYLIIDYQMEQALLNAAQSGVDVRIVTPGIPDKRMVYQSTKSHYEKLIRGGVKLYEYEPGFLHAKTFVCDDKFSTVGTINLDFRSLYLHFECGVWLYESPIIPEIKKDYEDILSVSRQVTLEDCKANVFTRLLRSLIELIAPMI